MAPKQNPKMKVKIIQGENNKNEKSETFEDLKEKTSVKSSVLEGSNDDEGKTSTNQTEDTAATYKNSDGEIGRLNSSSNRPSSSTEMSEDGDIVSLIIPETAQKIVHCLVGKDLFVDKTWCMVKKTDVLEDIAIEDTNSPFVNLTQRILAYKSNELLIGYEPFGQVANKFMLCLTEAGRDDVLNKLENVKSECLRRIEQSKKVEPRKWESLGSEELVDQFQIKNTRKLISLEWIGDISKRCYAEPVFEDCDPDSMKNGYTCLIPSDKEKFDLIYKTIQETGTQAVAQKTEASVQTDPEIPTNACTQYAPETEIALPDTSTTQEAIIKSQDLNTFFQKYQDYLLECLNYNEVYDLYHDDYPALYVGGEETQVQQLGTYHQYQSFTDVAAIEGKLVISSSWHPNYTGIVAIAYANEIPCLMKELEYDSDQTDYEEEKTDEEREVAEEPELGAGARDWLADEKLERESTAQNTELFDRAIKKLKDIESSKMVWDAKIQEEIEGMHRVESIESEKPAEIYEYKEYKEPEIEQDLQDVEEEYEEGDEAEGNIGEIHEDVKERGDVEEVFGTLGKEESVSQKTSKTSLREQLEADIHDTQTEKGSPNTQKAEEEIGHVPSLISRSRPGTSSFQLHDIIRSQSVGQRTLSAESSRRKAHHRKKHRRNVPWDRRQSQQVDQESTKSIKTPTSVISSSMSDIGKLESSKDIYYHDHEFFDEITDEEEIKEKQDELPLLELNNPVLIWSFVDDLTPKLRLDSPYEVRIVSFSQHDGNLVAGGTSSGQVVLWDITGRIEELERPEPLTQNQQKFRKRMEDLMNWRRDIRSKRRVRICAISNQKESHLERVTNLMWVGPSIVVTNTADIQENKLPALNLQLLTCSVHGDIKVWDLRADPMKVELKKQVQQFKTKERFGRPVSLDIGVSPFSKLHKRWKPDVTFMTSFKNTAVLLTGLNFYNPSMKYVRVHPKAAGVKELLEDRVEYKAIPAQLDSIPLQMYISNLFGEAGTMVWEPPEVKPPDGENIPHTCRFWDSYHDGPIHKVSKHSFIPSVCLTVGGHVFSVWHNANNEEPILTRRYYGIYITDGSWSSLRPSLIRIARSDGVVEIWDLIIQNHAPATTIIVSGRVITSISAPLLPEVRGLLGVADYNSAYRLFFIPQQFRIWTENELNRLKRFMNREPERKKKMKEWSKWWRENNVNPDREEKKQAEEKEKLDKEVRLEKEKQEEAKKKYNEEVYKWYMRRRGKPFLWKEEAEERWREKQEEHMYEMVMAKKKIDRTEMEILMRPILNEEKNEAYKHEKAEGRLKQADNIFRQTIELIFPKSSRKLSTAFGEENNVTEEYITLIDYYFGDHFEKLADEQDDIIKRSPWQFDFEWSELLEKYNNLRMLFNDRRRKRSKTLRWLRKKLREELLKEGRKVHIRKSHMARYPRKKIKRRQDNLNWLKQNYGEDYNVYWDKNYPCRRFADRKFRYPAEIGEVESQYLGELSEPDVEDEDIPVIFTDEKVKSSLELITEIGIEHISEEIFAADLDATLITLEGRSSLGVKSIPSFAGKSLKVSIDYPDGKPLSSSQHDESFPTMYEETLSIPQGLQSPQEDSDVSTVIDETDDTTSIVDNQMQELDYIQQSGGTKINVLQMKTTPSSHKKEVSQGVHIKLDESVSDEDDNDIGDLETESTGKEIIEEVDGKRGSSLDGETEVSTVATVNIEDDNEDNYNELTPEINDSQS